MADQEIDYIHGWDDGPMDGVAAHRASVPAMLGQISQRVRVGGILLTAMDISARSLGLRGTRRRELRYTTLDQELRDATA